MKKIFVSADFEGVVGVIDPRQCSPSHPWFQRGVRLWTEDVNAAVSGALDGGATAVVVNEAHAEMNYLDPEALHPRASLISGYVKVDNQMHGLDNTFAGVIILGHARAGTAQAVLAHTYVMRELIEIRLNGKPVGEFGLAALWAAYYGIPMLLAVGDECYCEEAQAEAPGIRTVAVKKGLAQFTAHHQPVTQARSDIRKAAEEVVEICASFQPPTLPESFRMEIEFIQPQAADLCAFIPTVTRLDGRTVAFESDDYRKLQQVRIVCTNLALVVAQTHFAAR
jgi:D-amino peptidase